VNENDLLSSTAAKVYAAAAGDLLFLQLTSGSTGIPKCIQLTHEVVIQHIVSSQRECGYKRGEWTLNWLPFDHVVPLVTCHLRDVYLGLNQVQASTAQVLERPLMWLELLAQFGCAYSWAPNFGYKLVLNAAKMRGEDVSPLDLSCMKRFLNAGEQCTREVCDAFVSYSGIESCVMQPAFGMAETSTCFSYCNNYSEASVKCLPTYPGTEFLDLGAPMMGMKVEPEETFFLSFLFFFSFHDKISGTDCGARWKE
jgi:acyl-CoA synthetase (AMP-forming)/AMP-acid ligase II